MKKKIDIIEYCGDCSRRYYRYNELVCEVTDIEIYENKPIPEWCPLMDASGYINLEKEELIRELNLIRGLADCTKYTTEEAKKLALDIEEIIDPLYCPKCGACGIDGCCSPDKCKELPCLYGEGYLKSYHDLQKENEELREFLQIIYQRLKSINYE